MGGLLRLSWCLLVSVSLQRFAPLCLHPANCLPVSAQSITVFKQLRLIARKQHDRLRRISYNLTCLCSTPCVPPCILSFSTPPHAHTLMHRASHFDNVPRQKPPHNTHHAQHKTKRRAALHCASLPHVLKYQHPHACAQHECGLYCMHAAEHTKRLKRQ